MERPEKTLRDRIRSEIAEIISDSDRTLNLSLLFATLVVFVYCYFGSYSFFENTFAGMPDLDYWKIIYHHCMNFLLLFCGGLLFIRFILKKPVKEFGLTFGVRRLGAMLMLAGLPVAMLSGLFSACDGQLSATYPLVDLNKYGTWYYVLGYFFSYFLYYIGWEFLYRGLLLNAGKKKMGVAGAILFTTMVSALIHTSIASFGKPVAETFSAIPAGIAFGYIAHKTRSMYPTLVIHSLIGFFTDLFVYLLTNVL